MAHHNSKQAIGHFHKHHNAGHHGDGHQDMDHHSDGHNLNKHTGGHQSTRHEGADYHSRMAANPRMKTNQTYQGHDNPEGSEPHNIGIKSNG